MRGEVGRSERGEGARGGVQRERVAEAIEEIGEVMPRYTRPRHATLRHATRAHVSDTPPLRHVTPRPLPRPRPVKPRHMTSTPRAGYGDSLAWQGRTPIEESCIAYQLRVTAARRTKLLTWSLHAVFWPNKRLFFGQNLMTSL